MVIKQKFDAEKTQRWREELWEREAAFLKGNSKGVEDYSNLNNTVEEKSRRLEELMEKEILSPLYQQHFGNA
jgi:hypothetical protein